MPTLQLATPEEVADFLRITTKALDHQRHRGTGPRFVRVGQRRVMYRWSDVESWLDASTFDKAAVR